MRRFLPTILSLSLLLTSCNGSGDDALARNCPTERTAVERFSLCLTEGWTHTTEEFGEKGNFVIVVHNQKIDQGVQINQEVMRIHVKKDPLQEPIRSTMAFAEQAVEIARRTAPNYKVVKTEPVTINREESLLHIFDASPDPEKASVRYYQFVTTNEGIAYGFTAVMNTGGNEELEQTLIDILINMQFT